MYQNISRTWLYHTCTHPWRKWVKPRVVKRMHTALGEPPSVFPTWYIHVAWSAVTFNWRVRFGLCKQQVHYAFSHRGGCEQHLPGAPCSRASSFEAASEQPTCGETCHECHPWAVSPQKNILHACWCPPPFLPISLFLPFSSSLTSQNSPMKGLFICTPPPCHVLSIPCAASSSWFYRAERGEGRPRKHRVTCLHSRQDRQGKKKSRYEPRSGRKCEESERGAS